jgi:Fungal protein kinase
MSGKVLEGNMPHTYLDDLESFYYVLCWILMVYTAPHKVKRTPPALASCWDSSLSHAYKMGQIASYTFNLPLEPWFGPCFQKLASRLRNFFHVRRPSMGDLAPPVDPKKDYDEYLGYIRECILDMDAEDVPAPQYLTSPSDASESSSPSSNDHLEETNSRSSQQS